jgi:prepilin-type N-terminal cleavage/methylation domain-containing protein
MNIRVEIGRETPPRTAGAGGFTIIELMVVVTIIGVLAAIASSHFVSYRLQAFDAQANSDLRNAVTAEEAYFINNGNYLSCSDAACDAGLPNFRRSRAVSLEMTASGGGSPSFVGIASSTPGTKTFTWDSTQGGFVP